MMRLVKSILIATDFSPGGHAALSAGRLVASKFQSDVYLLHVISGTVDFCSRDRQEVSHDAHERLQEVTRQLQAEGVHVADQIVAKGLPAEEIVRISDERDVNVTFVGACRHQEGCGRWGTTAARVRRHATKPVWGVKPNAGPAIARILCPVDFSNASCRALKNAIHLTRRLEAHLTVLAVHPDSSIRIGEEGAMAPEAGESPLPTEDKHLDWLLRPYDLHGVNHARMVRHGDPAQEIIDTAVRSEMDLLVMGTVGKTGLSRLLHGSVSRAVTRKPPCSILTVAADDVVRPCVDNELSDFGAILKQGLALLESGFAQEAIDQFQRCISRDMLCVVAWQGMADAHQRLGNLDAAQDYRRRAKQLLCGIWNRDPDDKTEAYHPCIGRKQYFF